MGLFDDLTPGNAGSFADLIPKPKPRGLLGFANDTVISAANQIAGGVGSIANAVVPGNRFSQFIDEDIVKAGEAKQSDIVRQSRERFQAELENADGAWDEAKAVGRYVADNPAQVLAQAAGALALVGLPMKGVGALARAAKLAPGATKGVEMATGSVLGGLMSGGDAAGTAYELVQQTPLDTLMLSPQAQELSRGGLDEKAIRDELGTRAARAAMPIPTLIGAGSGLIGAERILAGGKPLAGGALARGAQTALVEGAGEFADEAATQYFGQKGAAEYNPAIDPTKGVVGAGLLGMALGAPTGGVVGALSPGRDKVPAADPVAKVLDAGSIDEAIQAATEATTAPAAPPPPRFTPYSEDEANAALMRMESEMAGLAMRWGNNDKFGVRDWSPLVPQPGVAADVAAAQNESAFFSEQRRIAEADRAETEREQRIAAAGTAPVERAPRTGSTEGVTLDTAAPNAVQQFIQRQSQINTPAARAFVQEFRAGRITSDDVLALLVPDAKPSPDERLAAAAAQAPKPADADGLLLTADGFPYGSRIGAQARANKEGGEVVRVDGGFAVKPAAPAAAPTVASPAPAAPVAAAAPAAAQVVGFTPAPNGYRVRVSQHEKGSNVLDPTADVGAFVYEVKKGDDDRNPLTMVLNKDGKLVPAKLVLQEDNRSNGSAWVPPSAEAAAAVRALLEKRAGTNVGSPERAAVDAEIAAAVKGGPTAPAAPAAPQAAESAPAAPAPTARKTLQESRTDAALDKQVLDNGEQMTRRQWVERKVAEGLKTRVTQEDRIKPMSRMQFFRANNEEQRAHERKIKEGGKKDVFWIGDYEVTKTEHDYAERLAQKPTAPATPAAAAPVNPPKATKPAAAPADPAAPQLLRKATNPERMSPKLKQVALNKFPEQDGTENVFMPYGPDGAGFYRVPKGWKAQAPKPSAPPAPLYASRPVTNAADIMAWAASQGFKSTLPADDLHVTVAYSREPVAGDAVPGDVPTLTIRGGKRTVEPLGDEGAVVLKFTSPDMQARWKQYREAGASWDYESYTPHVTITYDGKGVDLSKVKPYDGPITLGSEKQEALNVDKADDYKGNEEPAAEPAPPPAAEKAPQAEATHKDPGEPAEPVTAEVVKDAIATAAENQDRPRSAIKADALRLIDEAIAKAPKEGNKRITIKVPGDGAFTVVNNVDRLKEFRRQVELSPGFKDKQPRPAIGKANESANYGPDQLAREMLEDGEPLNAIETLEAAGKTMMFGNANGDRPIPYTNGEPVEIAGIGDLFVGRGWSTKKGSTSWWSVIHKPSGFALGGSAGNKSEAIAEAKKLLAQPEKRAKMEEIVASGKSADGKPFKSQDELRAEFIEWAEKHQQATFAAADATVARAKAMREKEADLDAFYESIMGDGLKRPARTDWTQKSVEELLNAAEKQGKAEEALKFAREVVNSYNEPTVEKWATAYARRTQPTDTGWQTGFQAPGGYRRIRRDVTLTDGTTYRAELDERAGAYVTGLVQKWSTSNGTPKTVQTYSNDMDARRKADGFLDGLTAAAKPAQASPVNAPAPAPDAPVSSREGQMRLANRGSRIAALKLLNEQLRKIAPSEAWNDKNIEDATDLDALQDQISTALVEAQRAPTPVNPLRAELDEMSGAELRAIMDRMGLAGARMTQSERIEALLAEDEGAVRAAMTPTDAGEAPQLTEAQARKQFEWRDMGQAGGTKTHRLFFYLKPEDKGTGRAMGRGYVELYEGSSGWRVDGEGESYKALADAKKAAVEAAIPVLREQGWIAPADTSPTAPEEAKPAEPQEAKPPETAPMPYVAGIPRDVAQRAHAGTSHVPEVRAGQEQASFMGQLADAWDRAARVAGADEAARARISEVFAEVAEGYRARYLRTLEARSRVMSSMIAGPARFPVERNRKRMETERKRSDEASQFLARGIKRLLRAARGPIDNSPEAELESVRLRLAEREDLQESMKAANAALRKGDDAALEELGFTAEQIADLKKPDFAGRKGFPDYRIANNNAEIRRLRERLASAQDRMQDAAAGPVETERPGVRLVEDATDDRLRLFFDDKPSDAVRDALKAAAFKWSPNAGAWQRQLTDNARSAAKQVLDKHFPAAADGPLFSTDSGDYTAPDGTVFDPDTSADGARNIGMLERGVARGADSVHPYVGRSLRADEPLGRVADAFGGRIQWFDLRVDLDAQERRRFGFFNGANLKGTIFLRATGNDRPHLSVLGHEAGHRLKAERPDLYDQLVDAIAPFVDVDRYEADFKQTPVARNVTTEEGIQAEFIGEVLSDGFMDKGFWQAVSDKNPTLGARLLKIVTDLIDSIKAKVGYSKRTERYLSDYDRVMQIAGEVMAEFGVAPSSFSRAPSVNLALEASDAAGREFWRKIDNGESFTDQEVLDALSINRRGSRRTVKAMERTADLGGTGQAAVSWAGNLAGFGDYSSRAGWDGDNFNVAFVPDSLAEGADLNDAEQARDRALVHVSFRAARDGRYEISFNDPPVGSRADVAAGNAGVSSQTGREDNPYLRVDLAAGDVTSRTVLQEAIRRLALNIGSTPTLFYPRRDTGARAKQAESPGTFSADTLREKFSRGPGLRGKVSVRDARAMADELRTAFPRAPQIRVLEKVNQSPRALLEDIRAAGAELDVEAAFHKGEIYVFPGNVDSIERLRHVMTKHEIRHAGFRGLLGDGMDRTMLALYEANATVRKAADAKIAARLAGSKAEAVDEALADMTAADIAAMTGARPLLAKLRLALRRLAARLRAMGWTTVADAITPSGWSDADVVAMVLTAESMALRGQTDGTRFSRAPAVLSEAFKRWFGASKVVDADGKPLVVYHGTIADVSAFERTRSSRKAYYFAADPGVASEYTGGDPGGNVLPVFLALRNPMVIDAGGAEFASIIVNGARTNERALVRAAQDAGHDGLILRSVRDGAGPYGEKTPTDVYIAFLPEQIKSATGNAGTYDRTNPDIRYSRRSVAAAMADTINSVRGVSLPAGYKVADLLDSHGKITAWDKTVGTPFNLAKRNPGTFGKVYDRVQQFLNDISYHATEAANLAPSILPKLESLKDITKSPLSAADTKAIAAPIFEGTLTWTRDRMGKPISMEAAESRAEAMSVDEKASELLQAARIDPKVLRMWQGLPIDQYEAAVTTRYANEMLRPGVVWTDAELKRMFKLGDAQIKLYREFRASIDRSLDDLTKSEMIRMGGKDVAGMADALQAMSVTEARDAIADRLREVAETDEARAKTLDKAAQAVADLGTKAADLKARGYAPLTRFGSYTLDVVDAGERVYFGMFESQYEANRMQRKMREQFPRATIRQGTQDTEAFKMFAGISPETIELFGEILGLDSTGDEASDKAFQTFLQKARSTRSAMKRLIHRKGIDGFSEDAGRVLAGFLTSNARRTSTNMHLKGILDAVEEIPQQQGELKTYAAKMVDYVQNPVEEAAALRGVLFAQYLGGSIASALVNMSQPIMVTVPYLSQYGGAKQAAAAMVRAMKDMASGAKLEPALAKALKAAEEDGVVAPQEIHQLQAQARGQAALRSGDGTKAGNAAAIASNTLSRASLAWGKLFGFAELVNRRSTYIAAYRVGRAEGKPDPDAFARQAVVETQFTYNKGNRPQWARGAIGATLFTFKTYSVSYVELLGRLAKSGPEGRRAALLAVALLLLMSGADGLPFMEDAEDVLDAFMQRVMGRNWSTKQKRNELLAEVLGKDAGQFLQNGISGLPGVPIDVSGRMGMGNLIPGTALLRKDSNPERDTKEILGPAADLVERGFRGAGMVLQGDVGRAALEVSPVAARNVAKGADMLETSSYRDAKGRKVIDTTTTEAIAKMAGFQPATVARVQEATATVQRAIALTKTTEAEIADQWAQGLYEKDADKVAAARERLREWNADNETTPIKITFSQVAKRLKAMREDKATRMEKTAPKEIRREIRRELAEAGR